MQYIIVLLCFISLLCPIHAAHAESPADNDLPQLQLAFLSDLHFIAPELTDYGSLFMHLIRNGDGKAVRYCAEITDAFIEQIFDQPVDAVILQGDLTFNGAVESHLALAEKLRRITDAGIPVYVIPGNHDVYNINAARFEGDHFERIESATSARFREIWSAFGYDQADDCAPDSLSYVLNIAPDFRLLMVDVNTENNIGVLTNPTLDWIRKQLDAAQSNNQRIIAVSHQTLFSHNTLLTAGFQITGAEKLASLYAASHVLCNICGHMHIQHICGEETGLPEISVSSAAVAPCQYGLLTLYRGRMEYHTEVIDVSGWAAKHEISDPDLLDFSRYAAAFFAASLLREMPSDAATASQTIDQRKLIYLANLNAAYFSGNLTAFSASDQGYRDLLEESGFWPIYLKSIEPDLSKNYTSFQYTFGGNEN